MAFRVLIIDSHDSFTFNLVEELRHLGVEPDVVAFDDPAATIDGYDGFILSPGPGRPVFADGADLYASTDIRAQVLRSGLPCLGVCLGHQFMAIAAGATVAEVDPHHGVVETITHDGRGLFAGLPAALEVVRYHSLAIVDLPAGSELRVSATSGDGTIMALEHATAPWWGVQFHPESISSAHGRHLLANFLELCGVRRMVYRSLPFEVDPAAAFLRLHPSGDAVWLDDSTATGFSVMGSGRATTGRILPARRECQISDGSIADPFDWIDATLANRPLLREGGAFPFRPGLVGYLGYELGAVAGVGLAPATSSTPDFAFLELTRALVIGPGGQAWAVTTSDDEDAAAYFEDIEHALSDLEPVNLGPVPRLSLREVGGRRRYLEAIEAVKGHIRRGDTYEACLTTRLIGSGEATIHHYLRLREENPVPMGAFLRIGDLTVLSTSPERFVAIRGNQISSEPIKGTRPVTADPEELARNPKDLAENRMIVDLVRNDLAKVAQPGSVTVPELFTVRSFATVHQLVSTITAIRAPESTVGACLKAVFPGGSMTGAPKESTCRILERIESARGVYSGGLGWIGATGELDLSMVIRTLVSYRGELSYGVGGAILERSDPEAEYDEVRTKCEALRPIAQIEFPA